MPTLPATYFHLPLHLTGAARTTLKLDQILLPLLALHYPPIVLFRRLAAHLQKDRPAQLPPVSAAQLHLYGTLLEVFRYLVDRLAEGDTAGTLVAALGRSGLSQHTPPASAVLAGFVQLFPPAVPVREVTEPAQAQRILRELLLVRLAGENRAVVPFRHLFDDGELVRSTPYQEVMDRLTAALTQGPLLPGLGIPLMEALRAPLQSAPDSLAGQLGYIRDSWGHLLPRELFEGVLAAFDTLEEEQAARGVGGPGPSPVLEFSSAVMAGRLPAAAGHGAGYDQPEYEAFSPDADWMSNVVLMAKMTHVWLDQLSRSHGYPITRLDQIPDAELDQLAAWGFTGLWLIGLWERSPASRRIKELCGNPEAHASAYSLYDYTIAADLGGEPAFLNLRDRAWQRGIRLASDMVPNHCGIHSRWVQEHPDWFIQGDYPPFPGYRYHGEDLCPDPAVTIQIEDGYWSRDDAAVAFRMIDRRDGRTRFIYHGNDGTSIPWNDTAQLNYLLPEVREAVMQTILRVARLTPIIRFDAAMTLAKKHYQRLWFPQRGLGGGIPSRAEHAMSREQFDALFPREFWREVVDRVAREVPGTLLLAEAFWMMEGYFVRTLGMHRVYNSAFMNMLKAEDNAKYRQTIKNVLAFNPEILKRFVNFMNNPDEKTAVEQFGTQGKYFGACVLMCTMPGLPMFGHGQLQGFKEKYGMEYRRAYWDETVDQGLLQGHRIWIFPLLQRRWLFSGSERFALFDFRCHDGSLDENVFAYSNRAGGERAVVLYHNRHGRTAGWIREAAPVAVGDGGDGVRQGTLAEALELPGDAGCYLGFRDLATGLSYLRSGQELQERGLFVELTEYAFHLFWEFQELRESAEQPWGALCRELDGRGVPSLTEELVQFRHRPLIRAAAALFELLADRQPRQPLVAEPLDHAIRQLAAELPGEAPGDFEPQRLADDLGATHDPRVAAQTLRLVRRAGIGRRELPCGPLERRTLSAVLVTERLVAVLGDDPLTSYGLTRPVLAYLAGGGGVDPDGGRFLTERCAAVAAAWKRWSAPVLPDDGRRLAAVLVVPEVARFLLAHDDHGVTWFNKERFEELIRWLAVRGCLEQARGKVVVQVPVAELCLLAAGAGYRLRLLLELEAELTAAAAPMPG